MFTLASGFIGASSVIGDLELSTSDIEAAAWLAFIVYLGAMYFFIAGVFPREIRSGEKLTELAANYALRSYSTIRRAALESLVEAYGVNSAVIQTRARMLECLNYAVAVEVVLLVGVQVT
jgi:hypothetical protein